MSTPLPNYLPNKVTLLRRHWIVIFSVWLLAQIVFLYYNGGVEVWGEAGSYIGVTNRIFSSGLQEIGPRFCFYTVHILLLIAVRLVGLPYTYAYGVQLLVAAVALVCYVKMLIRYCRQISSVVIAATLFCICPFYQLWTCYLYTDANFANLLLISIYLLTQTHSSVKQKLFMVCLLALTFYRPLGILFVPIAIVFWLANKPPFYKTKILLATLYAIGIAMLIWYCLQSAKGYFYPGHNAEANIICGYGSNLTRYIQHPYDSNKSILHFFIANPSMTWRLLLGRLFKAFWLTRPYYSIIHNLIFVVMLVPFYFFAITGMVMLIRKKSFLKNAFLFVGLAIFTAPILLFCADWSNRFVLPELVFLFIFLGIGLDAVPGFVKRKYSGKFTNSTIAFP